MWIFFDFSLAGFQTLVAFAGVYGLYEFGTFVASAVAGTTEGGF